MTRLGLLSLATGLAVCLCGPTSLRADTATPGPDFDEVYNLVREHLSGVNQAQLNRLAVQSFLSALSPRVSIVGQKSEEQPKAGAAVTKSSLFEGPILYVRIGRVASGLDGDLRQLWQQASGTNKFAGLVLDLRFAGGTDYAAAVSAADLFIKKEQPLLDWGKGMVRTSSDGGVITVPLAILVNEKTAGAAEALAGVLRQAGAGLILGSRTAGLAMLQQEFPLKDGEVLSIATTPVHLGDGSSMSSQGLTPDIKVELTPAEERAYYADAFKDLASAGTRSMGSGTNTLVSAPRVRRPRFNEAELVRERRNGAVPDEALTGDEGDETDKPVVRDPVLGRALDFLKGLSVVRQTRS